MTEIALDSALANAERLLLDTSALIAYHNTGDKTHPLARHLLRRIKDERDPLRGYYSVISAAEILIRPHRSSQADFTFMHTFLSTFPNLAILEMDLMVATEVATIRSITRLRLPDAIVVASGLLAGCEAIVTNDAQWKGRLSDMFPTFRWLYMGDFV